MVSVATTDRVNLHRPDATVSRIVRTESTNPDALIRPYLAKELNSAALPKINASTTFVVATVSRIAKMAATNPDCVSWPIAATRNLSARVKPNASVSL